MNKVSEGVIFFKESFFYGFVIFISFKYLNLCCKLFLIILVMRLLGLIIELICFLNS